MVGIGEYNLIDKPLGVSKLEGGIISPEMPGIRGGVYYNGEYKESSSLCYGWYKRLRNGTPMHYVEDNRDVLYAGFFHRCWGHCITDELKHAWIALPEYKRLVGCLDTTLFAYVAPEDGAPYENFLQCWEAIGIGRDRLIRIDVPTRFKIVYLPDESFKFDPDRRMRVYAHEYNETIEAIRASCPPPPPPSNPPKRDVQRRYLYFSRTGWGAKKEYGEEIVRDVVCKSVNAKCVSPETLSLAELVCELAEAKGLITTDGSIAHNAVFMPRGGCVVLLHKSNHKNLYQEAIDNMRSLEIIEIPAHKSIFSYDTQNPVSGPFFMYVSPDLSRWLGIKRMPFPVLSFAKYCARFFKWRIRNLISRCVHEVLQMFRVY